MIFFKPQIFPEIHRLHSFSSLSSTVFKKIIIFSITLNVRCVINGIRNNGALLSGG